MPGRGVAVPDRVALAPDPALACTRCPGAPPPGPPTILPTWSSWYAVGAVVGRTWATQRNARGCRPPSTGTHSSRSAKDRSESSCQSPASRCRWSMSAGPRAVCSSTRSRSVDTTSACHTPGSQRGGDLLADRAVRPGPRRGPAPGPGPAAAAAGCPAAARSARRPRGTGSRAVAPGTSVGADRRPRRRAARRGGSAPRASTGRPARRRRRRAPARPGRPWRAGRAAGRRRRTRAPAGTRSPSA